MTKTGWTSGACPWAVGDYSHGSSWLVSHANTRGVPRGLKKLTGLKRELFLKFRDGNIDMSLPSFDWEPESYHEGDHQVVRMVLMAMPGEGAGSGTAGSLLMNVLTNRTAPTFSGEESDWEAFLHYCKIHADIMRESNGGHLPDVFLFDFFQPSVDAATPNRLCAMRKKEPDLTSAKFWQNRGPRIHPL